MQQTISRPAYFIEIFIIFLTHLPLHVKISINKDIPLSFLRYAAELNRISPAAGSLTGILQFSIVSYFYMHCTLFPNFLAVFLAKNQSIFGVNEILLSPLIFMMPLSIFRSKSSSVTICNLPSFTASVICSGVPVHIRLSKM